MRRPICACVTHLPRGWLTSGHLLLECPSGIAGNLFMTALSRCGVPDEVFSSLPTALGLPEQFSARKENDVWDGHWKSDDSTHVGGPVATMGRHAAYALNGRALDTAQAILHHRWSWDTTVYATDETWCDTLFDACAAAAGLAWLGWPNIYLLGPLPRGACAHPLATNILSQWRWHEADFPVELVTPTGAAILATVASQHDSLMPHATDRGTVSGRLSREHHLPPMQVFTVAAAS